MGSGASTQVVKYVPVENTAQTSSCNSGCGGSGGGSGGSSGGGSSASEYVPPAVAKSIQGDTSRAIENQEMERARGRGVGATYLRYKNRGTQTASGNQTLGGD